LSQKEEELRVRYEEIVKIENDVINDDGSDEKKADK